jgi:hypothetical protein
MKRDVLDRACGPTPQVFTDRIDNALRLLKEDEPMNVKRFTVRTALIAVLIALALCGIAYAIVATQGQEWYYNNRFTAYQEHEPEKQQAIMDNLQTEVPQEESSDNQGLIAVSVQDYAWAAQNNVFTLSIAARVTDEAKYELYSLWHLDCDGYYSDTPDPDDPESRTEHWLWTPNGFGLPEDVMNDPSKQLLLFEFIGGDVWIGDSGVIMPGYSADCFAGEDGASIWVMEMDLSRLNAEAIQNNADITQEVRDRMAAYAESANAAIAENTDSDGFLSLRMDYRVYPFSDGEIGEPTEGTVAFRVKTR